MYLKVIKISWIVFLAGLLSVFVWAKAVQHDWWGYFGGMPDLDQLENPKSNLASEVYSADGVLLGKYYRENRSRVGLDEISPNMTDALIATEDVRFYKHSGIDFISTLRVIWGVFTLDLQGGGSTISQQLAKNLFGTRGASYEGSLTTNEKGEARKGKLSKIIRLVTSKTKEWILATRIEKAYTKKEILTLYLNTVDFGRNSYGIKVASNRYFAKNPDSLNIQEAAVLVGLLKAPTKYNPTLNPDNSERRRNVVLDQMARYEYLGESQADSVKQLPLVVNENISDEEHHEGIATYFRMHIREELLEWAESQGHDLYTDGLKIHTTIHSGIQELAEQAVRKHMPELQERFFKHWKGKNPWLSNDGREIKNYLHYATKATDHYRKLRKVHGKDTAAIEKIMDTPVKMKVFSWHSPGFEADTLMSPRDSVRYYKHFLHTGMMAMEPKSGLVRAWVGGINHRYFQFDHVRQGARQPGSTFKPIVYSAAMLEKGYDPCFEVFDAPTTIPLPEGGSWTARNSDGYSSKNYTLRQALARSKNTIAAYLMKEVGPDIVIDYARKLGITTELEAVPSLCLGSSDVKVFDLVGAYATFVNEGVWTEPTYITKITDKDGQVLKEFVPKRKQAIEPREAYLMLHMVKGPAEERGGTATGLWRYKFRREMEVAAKTGTTSNYSDGWFMGMTKNLVVGIWVGAQERFIHFRNWEGQGAKMAMPIFAEFMESLHAEKNKTLFGDLGYEKGEFSKAPQDLGVELDCSKYDEVQPDSTEYRVPDGMPEDMDEIY